MIQKTFSTTTTAISKQQIWQLMANVNEWKTWDDSITQSQLNGTFQTGSTFLLQPKGGPKLTIKLAAVQSPGYFKDQTTFPLAKMYGEHWYEDTPQGLKITIRMTIKGLLSALWYQLVMKDIVARLEDDVKLQVANAKKL